MVRKLAAAMLGVGVFIPGLANALGLGEIKLNSALSEPLDAEIELVQVRELTSAEILPSLAGAEDFSNAQVERYHFLTDLKFEVIINDQGKQVIKIRSRKPVKEPFLNFLVEVNWPAGRLLREYTLLLDPPVYSAQPAAPVSAPKAAPQPTPAQPVRTYEPAPSQTTYSSGDYAQGAQVETHTIGANDSLWTIAKSMKPSDRVSIQQTMIAIQRINPDAFINDNINLLKKGAVLRAPTEEEVMSLSNQEAVALAAEQNRQWRERSGAAPEARQVDLTGRSTSREQDTAPTSREDRLKLVSAGDTTASTTGQGGSGGGGELRDQLVVAEENADKFRLENDELKLRLNDLEDQLDTSDKVLTLKDEQIAALQAKLRELESAQAAATQTPVESTLEPAVDEFAEEPVVEPEVVEETDEVLVANDLIGTEDPAEEVDYNFAEEPELEGDSVAGEATPAEPEIEVAPTVSGVEVEDPKPAVAPTPAPQPAQQDDLLSQVMNNPLYLAAGGGGIVLLIILGLVAARRKQGGEELQEDLPEEFDLPEAQETEDLMELDSVNLEEDDAFEEAVEASVDEETVPQTADVIGEADIYIAYGRFPQAIEMLEKAASSEPERADIRLKLCEVCAEANEPEVFMNHYRVLQDVGTADDVAKADGMRGKLSGIDDAPADDVVASDPMDMDGDETLIAEAPAESFDFDAIEPASDEEAASLEDSLDNALEQESDTGLDFDLGDLEDTGASFDSHIENEEPGQQAAGEVAGLDFDLNLDLDEDSSDTTEQPSEEASSMDFDLDASFTEEAPAAEEPTAEAPASEADTLDFDTDFALDDIGSSSAEPPAESNDLSMDFDSLEPESPAAAETPADDAMDFDLDFDSSTTELDDTPALDFSEEATDFEPIADVEPAQPADLNIEPEAPAEQPAQGDDEPVLDSQSAAQLADELDLDLDGDFLDSPVDTPADSALDAAPEAAPAADDDATIIAGVPPVAPAANDMSDSGEELDFLSDADEASTKLDLARAYIDMGDRDGAKDILDEVMIEGNDTQKGEAKELLTRLES